MILVVTPVARVQDCAEAIQEATQEGVQVAPSIRQALTLLRTQEYSAVLFDQALEETDPEDSEMVLERMGMAIPVHVNFAISKADRVVREARAALQRRKKEVKLARQGAQQALRSELKGPITALLLSCEMALQIPGLQEAAEAKMRAVYDLAQAVRAKLEAPA